MTTTQEASWIILAFVNIKAIDTIISLGGDSIYVPLAVMVAIMNTAMIFVSLAISAYRNGDDESMIYMLMWCSMLVASVSAFYGASGAYMTYTKLVSTINIITITHIIWAEVCKSLSKIEINYE